MVHLERTPEHERDHRHALLIDQVDIEPSLFRLGHRLAVELQRILFAVLRVSNDHRFQTLMGWISD